MSKDLLTLPLPHRLFLLSHQPATSRLDDDSAAVRGSLLRASAAAELCLAGLLRDRDGRAERTDVSPAGSLDPFLGQVLGDVSDAKPRRWFDLVSRQSTEAEDCVRDLLAAARVVTVEQRRVLGVFPARRIAVADPELVPSLRYRVRSAVLERPGSVPVPIEDALLAVLAIDGNVGTVFGARELWRRRAEARALADRVASALPGLRPAVIAAIAVDRSPAG